MKHLEWDHDLVAGKLCLELANTVGGLRGHEAPEYLPGYPDLVRWAVGAGAIGAARGRGLLAEAERRPGPAAAVLRQAHELREAIHDVVGARLRGRAPRAEDLDVLNRALARALSRRRLVPEKEGFALGWDEDPTALDAPLWPVATSAAELLTSERDLPRVRICGAAEDGRCGWLFVDESRAGTRRWCSMRDCGNRAKAKRHYERRRDPGAP
jgi:predicted RNA-binding Zn ribbon-like protein